MSYVRPEGAVPEVSLRPSVEERSEIHAAAAAAARRRLEKALRQRTRLAASYSARARRRQGAAIMGAAAVAVVSGRIAAFPEADVGEVERAIQLMPSDELIREALYGPA